MLSFPGDGCTSPWHTELSVESGEWIPRSALLDVCRFSFTYLNVLISNFYPSGFLPCVGGCECLSGAGLPAGVKPRPSYPCVFSYLFTFFLYLAFGSSRAPLLHLLNKCYLTKTTLTLPFTHSHCLRQKGNLRAGWVSAAKWDEQLVQQSYWHADSSGRCLLLDYCAHRELCDMVIIPWLLQALKL